ncbi:THAP domain-containing protein 11-like [Haliotis rufescens]|uniref:THAP domain-containing protein 11-like n=1 Tax=Haliotis rufescens TaxID=6454 RepID=UPI001EB00003|nr:THAP domain-containing protein 11-like [Haliotis rufescens]
MAAEHCCVPQCMSDTRYDKSVSFHSFPQDADLRKLWIVAIRRDEGPFFTVTKKTTVCSNHFLNEDYKYTPVRRTLKQGIVPSLFPWSSAKKPRKGPPSRQPLQPIARMRKQSLENLQQEPAFVKPDAGTQTDLCLPDTQQLLLRIQQLQQEKDDLSRQLTVERFGVERFSHDDAMMQYYTSFRDYHSFKIFFDFVKPSAFNM